MHSVNPNTLAALLELLRDDSPTVVAAAREKLVSLGAAGEHALRIAVISNDARMRVRARAALLEIGREKAVARFELLATKNDAELDLEDGAFALAQIEYPDLDLAAYTTILDTLGEQLLSRLNISGTPSTRTPPQGCAAELSRLLAHEWRLRMNDESFDDPENSYIHRVLDRRRGIPISLATIYLSVAKRAKLPLYGIGSPGHYLLRYGPSDLDIYMDPTTGRRLGLDECARMLAVRGFPVTREHFEPSSARETLIRMCANLVTAYERRKLKANSERFAKLRDAMRAGGTGKK
ncbi:MAG: SirB1 family protein [Planctomycetota bacterium]